MRLASFVFLLLAILTAKLTGFSQIPGNTAPQHNADCVSGKPTAPIKIEVFSDFQCPGCRDLYLHTMRSVFTDYAEAGKVCVVYHELPLSMHQHAREAARYGHAAQRLGQHEWMQVATALYLAQDQWAKDGKIDNVVAGALSKEEMAKLRKEMAKPSTDAAITSDLNLAKKLVIEQTPTMIVTTQSKTERTAGVVQYPIMRRYLDYYLTH
jgi:protein-disulfide isomerase